MSTFQFILIIENPTQGLDELCISLSISQKLNNLSSYSDIKNMEIICEIIINIFRN